MTQLTTKLQTYLADTINGLGFHFVGSEWSGGHVPVLRVFVEGLNGTPITLTEITVITRQLSALLDVELSGSGRYRLEISSPGLERRLFTLADFDRFSGQQVKIKMVAPVEDRRNWVGELKGIKDDTIILNVEGQTHYFAFSNIDKANLIPDYKMQQKK